MMRIKVFGALVAAVLLLAGCNQDLAGLPKPPPQEPTATSVAYFCSMGLLEHGGPKAQAFRAGKSEPIWFSSVRDAVAFSMLPGEPKDIVAIYVNDMAKVRNWDRPEAGAWVEAHDAWYAIGSDYNAGMGGKEVVPFSDEKAAQSFTATHGGTVVRFNDIPENYVLESDLGDHVADFSVAYSMQPKTAVIQ
ncbi:copper resistance protein CopZ [Mesorhizobium sp. M1E.F.Ca.ET.045.02.1.1]|uniref:nitrous oxide reductase accessory protein NosL n=1 Tax=unclassified Mesorhizobium TaxID=325217 RepID=UPI000F7634C7|nr:MULTISPECIES: nitrous oxide reductase accessory protein NosL [unclassified Mesorhizobium]AZO23603.1 copper resistance protein CopZ [Mesorhizobium sp. M1E.F.Ca.ET.045.02.1.1]RUW31374.1 copper resistance protein CopZ [Mesorhizobium sp. M1E.F.Ca.ET.041.01.1.1]